MLNRWQLKDYAPGEGNVFGAFHEQFDTHEWLDISVLGGVHQALLAAGRILDPFYDQNEKECAWIEEREWWYRVQFASEQAVLAHDERLLLVFHGLDTFATIWLNGKELGKSSNMFREAVFDVSHALYSDQLNRSDTDDICNASEFNRFDELSSRVSAYAIKDKGIRLCKNKI